MNPLNLKDRIMRAASALVLAGSIFLAACGGSSSSTETAGIGGTGIGVGGTGIVSGRITDFGSIHVNDRVFETDDSQFNVDGETFVGLAGQNKLAIGMVIRLSAEVENGVFSNTALAVAYDDEVEGPVSAVIDLGTTKDITVFGKTITIDQTSTLFEDADFNDIAIDNVVKVSGYRVSQTQINATYVKRTVDVVDYGNTEVELRGIITDYDEGIPPGIPETFKIDGITIETDVDTEIEVPNGMLVDGIYVEVEGAIQSPISVLAEEIELEDEDFDDDVDKISLEGIVSGFAGGGITNFFVDSQRVNASMAEFSPAGLMLMDGLKIEVEGPIIGGILIAEEVEEE